MPRRPCGPPRNDNGFLSFRGAERRGNPSFLRWTGDGPPRSSAPTEGLPKSQQRADVGIGPYAKKGKLPRPPRQRLAKRKARKEELVKFSLCPITSECSTAYNVRKSQQSPARAHVGITSSEQNGLAPHPAARQGASRARNCAAISVFSFDGSTAVYLRLRAAAARRLPPAHACGRSLFAAAKRKWGWKAAGLPRRPSFPAGPAGTIFPPPVIGIGPCGRNVGGPRRRRGRFPSSLW